MFNTKGMIKDIINKGAKETKRNLFFKIAFSQNTNPPNHVSPTTTSFDLIKSGIKIKCKISCTDVSNTIEKINNTKFSCIEIPPESRLIPKSFNENGEIQCSIANVTIPSMNIIGIEIPIACINELGSFNFLNPLLIK